MIPTDIETTPFMPGVRRMPGSAIVYLRPHSDEQLPAPDSPVYRLSARQVRIIGLVAAGLSKRQIAPLLGISELTVKSHIYRAQYALGVHSSTEMVLVCLRAGVIA